VHIDNGTLAGVGTITGATTVGTGAGPGATLSPGEKAGHVGTVKLRTLTFNSEATYSYDLDFDSTTGDEVVTRGIIINPGAQILVNAVGTTTVPPGNVFTAISNTSANPITGTFSNLPDGAIVNVNGNKLQASYAGGDGNDLTLTVIP
jgi:hypothetical protein